MALFAIGDLHLASGVSKPMDIFPGWENHVARLEGHWRRLIGPEDTVVLAGDISWAMRLEDALEDFAFIHSLPGQKLILKGNHDYWWTTANKMNTFFASNGLDSLHLLHNNSYTVEGYAVCGTRSWLFEAGEPHDEKVMGKTGVPSLSAGLPGHQRAGGDCLIKGIWRSALLLRAFTWKFYSSCGARQCGWHHISVDFSRWLEFLPVEN